MMANEEILRRPGYGARSPVVGQRGGRTRRQILQVALRELTSRSFHDVSVDDLARAAGVSRATFYQYFESKDAIFAELLEECGATLMRLVRRLGQLGPTVVGFDNLHWWLGEWAWVYDRYGALFAQWDHIETSDTAFRPLVTGFVDAFAGRIAERLAAGGFAGVVGVDTPAALLLLVHRFNYLRHTGRAGDLSAAELLDGFAVVLQLVLFPDTPPEVLAGLGAQDAPAPSRWSARPAPPVRRDEERRERFHRLGDRAQRTVRLVLDAAAHTFAARGFAPTNVDAVAADAGVSRATLYKYFDDKLDILTVLAEEARGDVVALAGGFADIGVPPGRAAALRAWLHQLVVLSRQHAGVMRVWVERQPGDPRVQELGEDVTRAVRSAVVATLGSVQRPYPLHLQVAALVLIALLERLPVGLAQQSRPVTDDEVVETMAVFIERGLLAGRPVDTVAAVAS
jgi:AcrR family transcriptional regulator